MYKDYLKTKHWKEVKHLAYIDKPYRCYFCKERKNLQLHHVTYENLGKEKIDDIIYLCVKHHKYVTFSKEKDVVQKWLERIRRRNIRNRQFWGGKTLKERIDKKRRKNLKHWRKQSYGCLEYPKLTKRKNYAGLFTWKANEVKNNVNA